jgi:murein DD-endopeptidase MepM/ murein hydrolase activator NlpD
MNGTLDPSETFAIDWVQVDSHGLAYRTDGKKPEDWLCYGAEILAVAAGTVVEVVRDLPNVTPGKNPEGLSIPQIAGNRVIIDMGSGHYAMYAHLAPDSIQVNVGDHVQQGQKLGLLGNTGNSSAPHLHFQVMDRPSSLDDTSLPFVFDHMNLEGHVLLDLAVLDENTDKKIALPMDKKEAKPLTRVMPLSRDVVGFQ